MPSSHAVSYLHATSDLDSGLYLLVLFKADFAPASDDAESMRPIKECAVPSAICSCGVLPFCALRSLAGGDSAACPRDRFLSTTARLLVSHQIRDAAMTKREKGLESLVISVFPHEIAAELMGALEPPVRREQRVSTCAVQEPLNDDNDGGGSGEAPADAIAAPRSSRASGGNSSRRTSQIAKTPRESRTSQLDERERDRSEGSATRWVTGRTSAAHRSSGCETFAPGSNAARDSLRGSGLELARRASLAGGARGLGPGRIAPRFHEVVTVVFCDVIGFTSMCSAADPLEARIVPRRLCSTAPLLCLSHLPPQRRTPACPAAFLTFT